MVVAGAARLCAGWRRNIAANIVLMWRMSAPVRASIWDWVLRNPFSLLGIVSLLVTIFSIPYVIYSGLSVWVPVIAGGISFLAFMIAGHLVLPAIKILVKLCAWLWLFIFKKGLGPATRITLSDPHTGVYTLLVIVASVGYLMAELVPDKAFATNTYTIATIAGVAALFQLLGYCTVVRTKRSAAAKFALGFIGAVFLAVPVSLGALKLVDWTNLYLIIPGFAGTALLIGSLVFAVKDLTRK